LRKIVENDRKRKIEIVNEEKKKQQRADELQKTMKSKLPIEINDSRRMMTTDYKGHPLPMWPENPDNLPTIMVKTGIRLRNR